jgi:hypothetical protein
VGEAHDGLRGANRPHAVAAGQAGSDVVDDGQQLGAVVLELPSALAERERQAADLSLPDGLLAAGMNTELTAGERGQGPARQGRAGGAPVGVIPGQQQGTQPPGLRSAGPGDLLARHQQDPQGFPVAVRARHRQPARVQAQRGQHRQVGVDGVGLSFAAALPAAGLLALEHQEPGGGQRPAQPRAVSAGALNRDRHPRPATSAMASSSRANPALSLPIRITAIGLPAASAISTS